MISFFPNSNSNSESVYKKYIHIQHLCSEKTSPGKKNPKKTLHNKSTPVFNIWTHFTTKEIFFGTKTIWTCRIKSLKNDLFPVQLQENLYNLLAETHVLGVELLHVGRRHFIQGAVAARGSGLQALQARSSPVHSRAAEARHVSTP